ncbi:glycoside hydrolase family 108 protein [Novosphingobium sp. NPDC080210]|uniref:glycoside hydrolase family 108 protein n=1 Tax=Novosphingobium sp. NPDC080210 TaxID=3390596 RepID=UPI003D03F3C6
MTINVNQMLSDLLRVEGGYVNDPRDAGGETNFGITKATAVANGYTGSMRDLTKDQALEIYRKQYFYTPGFGLVADAGVPSVAAELFDTGVNMGPAVAAKFLQQSLNALNNQGKDYADITVDGKIGPGTINALKGLIKKRGLEDTETVLLKALNCLQGARYISLAESRPTNEAFLFGWLMNRVELPS